MSIDAIVRKVTYGKDGTATLHLIGREPGSLPGQSILVVVNPKPNMEAMEGVAIWGGSGEIMVGDTKFANRVSYTCIELVERTKYVD